MGKNAKALERAGAALLAAIGVAAVLSGCGGDSEPEPGRDAVAALERIQGDFEAGDVAAVCAQVVAQPRCREVVTHLLDEATPSKSVVRSRERDPIGAHVAGRRATVRVAVADRIDGRVGMVRRGGEWKLVGIRMRPDLSRWRWRRLPPALKDPQPAATPLSCPPIVSVGDGGREPVVGGCEVRLSDPEMRIVMLTAFGDFTVARCGLAFTLHLAGDSDEVLADDVDFDGPDVCAGLGPCGDGHTEVSYPWRGDALRGPLGAGMRLRLEICVRTSLGFAKGLWHYRLMRKDGEVVARSYDYPIGASSIMFLGTWDAEPDDFVLEQG